MLTGRIREIRRRVKGTNGDVEGEAVTQYEQDIEIDRCMSWMRNDYPKKLIPEPEYEPIRGLCKYTIIMLLGLSVASGGTVLLLTHKPPYGILGSIIYAGFIIYLLLESSSEFLSDYLDYFVQTYQPKKIAWDSKYLYLWTRQDHIILLPWDRLVRLRNNGNRWSLFISRPKAIFSREFFIGLTYDVGLKLREYIEKNQIGVKVDE